MMPGPWRRVTGDRCSGFAGYNAQAALKTRHRVIVTQDVIRIGRDRASLTPMAKQATVARAVDDLYAVADGGYFSSARRRSRCPGTASTALVVVVVQ